MCSKANVRVFLLGLNTLIMVSAVALALMFFLLIFNSQWNIAYGSVVIGWAVGMPLSAILLAAVGCMSFYGASHHNKFMLLMASGVAMLVIVIQVSVATNIKSFTEPTFPADLVDSCLANGAESAVDTADCKTYYEDETTRRHFSAWLSFYMESQDDELVKQDLVSIESGSYCCGFGPALTCTGANSEEVIYVTDALIESEDPFGDIQSKCFAEEDGWFAPQRHCKVEVLPSLKRGCPYMYSASTACMRDSTVRAGCARVYAEQVRDGILPIANIALILILFQALVCLGSCCMCLKRKDHDVLPPPEAFVDKKYEKYRFDVEEPAVDPAAAAVAAAAIK